MLPVFSSWLLCMLLTLFSSASFSQQDAESCQLTTIKDGFHSYLKTTVRQRISTIQDQLNALGYGPIESDGVLGADTRQALQHFCQINGVKSSPDEIAMVLVELLDQIPTKQDPPQTQPDAISPAEGQAHAETEADEMVYYRWSTPEEEQADSENARPGESDEQLAAEKALFEEIITALSAIEGVAYANEMLFKYALEHLFLDSKLDYRPFLDQILAQARIVPDEKLNRLQLSGDGCGCSADFSTLVYGFYPSWLAAADAEQVVDFSLFDRIGFYALSLNHQGGIDQPLQWSNRFGAADFINVAHKHWVDVDVVIQATDWQTWDSKRLMRAAVSTADQVTQVFKPADRSLLSSLKSIPESNSSAQGDGVTLVFDDYSGSIDNRTNIINFVTELAKILDDNDRKYQLNIMLDIDVNSLAQQSAFKDLDAILLEHNDKPALVDHVFVMLQQSTSKAKKTLRRIIEEEFSGAERKAVMRKIVPVISPHDEMNQFTDDLIYLQDNFAGVGLWPLPLDSDTDVEMVKDKIIELYSSTKSNTYVGSIINKYVPEVCQFACPNRWLFRISFDVLAGLILLYAVLAIWIYRLRSLYQQYFLYYLAFILLTVIIFLISLVCDPFWQARADAVIAAMLLLVIAILIWRYVSRATRPPLP